MSKTDQLQRPALVNYLSPNNNPLTNALQWYSRNCMSWTLFFIAAVGIPWLYY